jgi:heterodisulfide reductase subunit D
VIELLGGMIKVKNPTKSDIIYFVGCTTAYRQPEIAKATSKIFEQAEVDYIILHPDEWCCGSPLLRTGQKELAEKMIHHNIDAIKKTGVKTVVTSCAGCYATLKNDYPAFVKDLGFEIIHSSEFIKKLIKEGKLKLKETKEKVTYHDPCHLGRHGGLYDPPREVLKSIPKIDLVEMLRRRKNSWCCGGGGGLISGNPEIASKAAHIRLKEAVDTGADTLVSTCPFCKLNLSREAENSKIKISIKDLSEIVQKNLEKEDKD